MDQPAAACIFTYLLIGCSVAYGSAWSYANHFSPITQRKEKGCGGLCRKAYMQWPYWKTLTGQKITVPDLTCGH